MSSQENTSTFQESEKVHLNKGTYITPSTHSQLPEEKAENNRLIRPIPVNIKVIKKPKSELTTMGDSTLTIKNVIHELKMPIMYNNFNYTSLPQNVLYMDDLNQRKNINYGNKVENNSFSFQKDKPCCSCTKTKCIKKYCECFANHKYCIDCHCQNCMNKLTEINPIQNNNISSITENDNELEQTICTCTKSNCCKKYCECFKINKKCSKRCRCLNCMNMDSKNIKKDLEKNKKRMNVIKINKFIKDKLINDVITKNKINSEEKNNISNNASEIDNLEDNFTIQRISVLINKYHTEINVEKISKEELNLLCQKRKRS